MNPTLLFTAVNGILAFAAVRLTVSPFAALMYRGGIVARNYQGRTIPTGVGAVVPLGSALSFALSTWYGSHLGTLWLGLLFGVGFLGLLDDAAGDRRQGGFVGHFKALFQGEATTGALKAIFGGLIALVAGWSLHPAIFPAFLAALVIALATNAVNLLDVRPGRALKGYFLMIAAAFVGLAASGSLLMPVEPALAAAPFGAAVALWGGDVKARYMLGDAGANALGAGAGMLLAMMGFAWQIFAAMALVGFHYYAEKHSITEAIARFPWLDRVDNWGRSKG